MSTPTKTSPRGVALIRDLEGASRQAYVCPAGYLTIGVGHMLTQSEIMSGKIRIGDRLVKWRDRLSMDDVDALLAQDLETREAAVSKLLRVALTQGQFDALVSFVFNVGWGAFADSTLLRKLNMGDYAAVPGELRRWVKVNRREVQGLINRREREVFMWGSQG